MQKSRFLLHLCFGILTLTLGAGCTRDFVAPTPPSIQVLAPKSTEEVVQQATLPFIVRASSFRAVQSVTVNGQAMQFNKSLDQWEKAVELAQGVNGFVVSATDLEGLSHKDTVWIARSNANSSTGSLNLPEKRGAFSLTTLRDGRQLILGGSTSTSAPASNKAFILSADGTHLGNLEEGMLYPRLGHTTQVLSDGRVLILGGSTVFDPKTVHQLVEEVELYDPRLQTFKRIPVASTAPIRRTHHVSWTLSDPNNRRNTYVYLFGGKGDVRYGINPTIGIRQDFRSFIFRNDSLVALAPVFGEAFLRPLEGATLSTLQSSDANPRFLMAGSQFNEDGTAKGDLFQLSVGLKTLKEQSILPFLALRKFHSSSVLAPNLLIFIGGTATTPETAVSTIELAYLGPQRRFRFPLNLSLQQKRFAHRATFAQGGRILLIGGFDENGNALQTSELWSFTNL